jgi:hypothetical protein
MPRLFISRPAEAFIGSPFFANLDGPVGPGRMNRRGDVILVQFLMHASRKRWTDPRSSIARDGIFGDETKGAILQFQKNVVGLFGPVLQKVDGIVDTARTGGSVRTSTLGWLHHLYIVDNKDLWPDFQMHPEWPGSPDVGLFF